MIEKEREFFIVGTAGQASGTGCNAYAKKKHSPSDDDSKTLSSRCVSLAIALFLFVVLSVSVIAVQNLMALQGTADDAGIPINGGNVVVTIWTQATGGTLVYNSSSDYNGVINNGRFDIMLGDGVQQLNMEYGKTYYMDMEINGQDMTFNGSDRRMFQSSVGNVNASIVINPLWLNLSDQRYNDTARINSVNTSGNIRSMGFNLTSELNNLYYASSNPSGFITTAVSTLTNYYLKTQIYNRTETYNKSEVYNKTEINSLINSTNQTVYINTTNNITNYVNTTNNITTYINMTNNVTNNFTISNESILSVCNVFNFSSDNSSLWLNKLDISDQRFNDTQGYIAYIAAINLTNGTNGQLSPILRGIKNTTYSADVLETDNYFNSPFFGYGCYENWILQSEDFGTTWVRINGVAITNNNAISPIGTLIAENVLGNVTNTGLYQSVTSSVTGNVTFSVWIRTYNNAQDNATVRLWLHSNNDSIYPIPIINVSITPYWQRFNVTTNFNFSHTIKNVTLFNDGINISLWGAQLENGTRASINGMPITTVSRTTPTCGIMVRGTPTFQSNPVVPGITSSGSCGCTAVAAGGAISGATTISMNGAFSGATTIANSGAQTCTYASTLNTLSLYGLILTSGASTSAIPVQGAPLMSFRSTIWNGTASTNQEFNFGTTGDNLSKTTSLILFNRNDKGLNTTILNITQPIVGGIVNVTWSNNTLEQHYANDNLSQRMCLNISQTGTVTAYKC
jgi:hypothetical protein